MNAEEFKQQFLPCHRQLYRIAFRLLGNAQDAEDMVQEAYLKLWNRRDELADIDNTEAYCITLVKHLCYDSLRLVHPDEDDRPPEELPLAAESNVAREVEERDEVGQVKRLIGRLPRPQRQVILMRVKEDGELTTIYLKQLKSGQKEFVLCIDEKDDGFTLIVITGNLTAEEIKSIIDKD